MFRRLLPTLIALALGLAGLGWGLWSLQRIFATEREDARDSLRSRREALDQYALTTLRQWLKDQLEEAQPFIDEAEADPLMMARGLYLREQGEQKLPRLARTLPGEVAPDFKLPRAGGGTLRLSELRGRPVLLHFGSFT